MFVGDVEIEGDGADEKNWGDDALGAVFMEFRTWTQATSFGRRMVFMHRSFSMHCSCSTLWIMTRESSSPAAKESARSSAMEAIL